ncbi:MAG: hypothetical protein WDO14_19455 [Bacteroidota bacterium]
MSNPLDSLSSSSSGLVVNGEGAGYLKETGGWARFLSILGFVFVGLILIMAFFIGGIMSAAGMGSQFAGFEVVFGVIYIAGAALYFFPILYLFRFASSAIEAVKQNDQAALTTSLKNLKSHYKFIGILTAIVLGFYVLALVIALLAGAMM